MQIDSHRSPIKPQTQPQTRDESPGYSYTAPPLHRPAPDDPAPPILASIVSICRRIGRHPRTMQIEFQ